MATKKVYFDGHVFDKRTGDMLKEVQRRFGKRLTVYQGSYSRGQYSAGTHSGGGAVDLGIPYSAKDDLRLLKIMREVGFAAWIRDRRDGFGDHIHGIAIGAPSLGRVALGQVRDYLATPQRNGLRGHARDRYAFLNVPKRTWEQYLRLKKKPNKSTYPLPAGWSFGFTAGEKGINRVRTIDGRGKSGYRYTNHIKRIQRKLGVEQAGVFGPKTQAAVKAWQKKRGITPTGRVGPFTWNKLGL